MDNTVIIEKSTLSGSVNIPPSKSAAHRAIICAALADGTSTISNIELSADIKATIGAMSSLGAKITVDGSCAIVQGISKSQTDGKITIDCCESGSTLRFLIPVAAALGINAVFTGTGRLPQRPIGEYLRILPEHSVKCECSGGLPLEITGKLSPGKFEISGNVSSQYITGLLLALPLTGVQCEIILTTALESAGYVDMTTDIMREFGINIQKTNSGYIYNGGKYISRDFTVEGDWSQAAFYLSAGALGGDITVNGLSKNTSQRDIEALRLFSEMGADISWDGNALHIAKKDLKAIDIDAMDIPDIIPSLAVTAAFCSGTTTVRNAARLRIKESDRIAAVARGLTAMGVDVTVTDDGMVIHGGIPHGAKIDGCNDHRIVMSFAMAGAVTGNMEISDPQSINKSYPRFFEDYTKIGGKANGLCLGK